MNILNKNTCCFCKGDSLEKDLWPKKSTMVTIQQSDEILEYYFFDTFQSGTAIKRDKPTLFSVFYIVCEEFKGI